MASHPAQPYLSVRNVRKEFAVGPERTISVLDDVSLDVQAGEFLAIVGPSGCGKTTLLRLIAGLVQPTAGELFVAGRRFTEPPPEIIYLSQQYNKSLFPWRTVQRNVEFPLEHRHDIGRTERISLAKQSLGRVGLGDVGDRYPWQLSGGMQQRVAIARALVAQPTVLLLDEPFSSVDALTRMELQDLMLKAWQEHNLTMLLVTHDLEEAIYMSDRVAAMIRRPTSIAETLQIDLPRPRDQLATRASPRFLELRQHFYGFVRQKAPEAER